MRLKPIPEQVVVVFGASSGIGRQTALQFARYGAKVVVSARGEEGLDSLVSEIEALGGEALFIPADAANFDEVQAVAEAAAQRFGRIDTWAHVAAVALWATFEQTTPEEFRRVLEVNLLGQAHGAWAALPYLKRQGGALIFVTSVEAERALPFHSAYAASKHGVHGLVEALRMELAHEGAPVSVTEIQPSTINTPLFDKARNKVGYKPMGLPPLYPPALVADAILHAAAYPVREWVVGGAGRALVTGQRVSPRLMDALLGRTAFRGQLTSEPHPENRPDNLYQPTRGMDQTEGSFQKQARVMSVSRWLQNDRATQVALAAAAVGLALLAGRSSRSRG